MSLCSVNSEQDRKSRLTCSGPWRTASETSAPMNQRSAPSISPTAAVVRTLTAHTRPSKSTTRSL